MAESEFDKKRQITGRDFIYILTIVLTGVTSYFSSYYSAEAERQELKLQVEENIEKIEEVSNELKQYNLETMMYILNSIEEKVDNLQKDMKEFRRD
jgi:tryptophanyl-tRNA synthetase